MSMYDKTHYNTVISLQLIKINEKKKKEKDKILGELDTGNFTGCTFYPLFPQEEPLQALREYCVPKTM